MSIPQLKDIGKAVQLYYRLIDLSSADIMELFGCCRSTANKLKKAAKQAEAQERIQAIDAERAMTENAYKVWGLDTADLERRLKKLTRLDPSGKRQENIAGKETPPC